MQSIRIKLRKSSMSLKDMISSIDKWYDDCCFFFLSTDIASKPSLSHLSIFGSLIECVATNRLTDNIHPKWRLSIHLVVMMRTTHLGIQFLDRISLGKSSSVRMKLHIKIHRFHSLGSLRTCTSSSQCCCLQPISHTKHTYQTFKISIMCFS